MAKDDAVDAKAMAVVGGLAASSPFSSSVLAMGTPYQQAASVLLHQQMRDNIMGSSGPSPGNLGIGVHETPRDIAMRTLVQRARKALDDQTVEQREQLRRLLQVTWYVDSGTWTDITDDMLDTIIRTEEAFAGEEQRAEAARSQQMREALAGMRIVPAQLQTPTLIPTTVIPSRPWWKQWP